FQAPFGGFGPTASIAGFALLIAIVGAAVAVHGRRNHPADLLLLAAFLVLALLARRNLPFFALVALPSAAPALDGALARVQEPPPAGGGARLVPPRAAGVALGAAILGASGLLLADVWSNHFFARDGTQRYFGRGEAPGFYPVGAAEFVLKTPIRGAVL